MALTVLARTSRNEPSSSQQRRSKTCVIYSLRKPRVFSAAKMVVLPSRLSRPSSSCILPQPLQEETGLRECIASLHSLCYGVCDSNRGFIVSTTAMLRMLKKDESYPVHSGGSLPWRGWFDLVLMPSVTLLILYI